MPASGVRNHRRLLDGWGGAQVQHWYAGFSLEDAILDG